LPSEDGRSLVTDFVSKDILDAQLADIAAHGVHIATLADSEDTLWDALAEYRSYGMTEPYIYRGDGDPQAIEAERASKNEPSLLYYADPDPLSDTQSRVANLNKGGLAITTYITSQAEYDALEPDLDLPVYSVDCSYSQRLVRTDGQRVSSKRDWWYWPAANDDPLTNRVDSGYLLWRSRLYGAFLPAYQTAFGADPYDENSAGAAPKEAEYRPEMLAYPAKDGVIDTLQWEAVREGVNDTRYLTTMYAALRECKDAHIAKPLVDAAESYVETFMDEPLASLPETALDAARAKIASYAVQLRKAVDTYNAAKPVQP
jgi:hypothetical protein